MRQQLAESDRVLLRESVGRNFPGLEISIHIGVEIELARLNQAQRRKGGDRLAD
jgi:hypothetical protein